MELDYKNTLDEDLENSKKNKNVIITPFMQHEWVGMKRVKKDSMLLNYEYIC